MTKKDYILLAAALKPFCEHPASRTVMIQVVDSLCDTLALENERFNRGQFWNACGVRSPCQPSEGANS